MKNSITKAITTKSGKVSKNITSMLMNCRLDEKQNRIYTGYYSGSGRFTSAHSAQTTVLEILKAGGYKYTTGNDAPHGGIKGDYVQVSPVAFKVIADIRQMWYNK